MNVNEHFIIRSITKKFEFLEVPINFGTRFSIYKLMLRKTFDITSVRRFMSIT
jgi:hypothetical protein